MRWCYYHRVRYVLNISIVVGRGKITEEKLSWLERLPANRETTITGLTFLKDQLCVCIVRVGIELDWVRVGHIVRQKHILEYDNAVGS